MQPLPVDPLLPDVVSHLRAGNRLVLQASPGAGKTTRVPAALLDAGLARDKQIMVLEPRRIAARAAAEFVAQERGGRVGNEIGYRVRFEQRGGASTRLWFLTEGVLGRQLVGDPFLEEVGIVVLDEFHERHLQGDTLLAVVRDLQHTVRPDLKLVVMSATLETERIAAYLDGCPVVTSAGRAYPVRVEYDAAPDPRPLAGRVAAALRRIYSDPTDDGGDVLVFLPGAAEIRKAAEAIAPLAADSNLTVVHLHGDLPLDAQQRAIRKGTRRKVVLATNVAETALTVEGVTVVIDSGLARIARFNARQGINVTRITPISRAAAEQRAGRAGRTAPGRCVRLWTMAEEAGRRPRETPEVLRLDLSATVLELRAWGLHDLRTFGWLDPPPSAALQRAEELLGLLGAIDTASGAVTDTGERMLGLAVEPRLARVLVEAERRGCATRGALVAALASERDICLERRALAAAPSDAAHWAAEASDLLLRLRLFEEAERRHFDRGVCADLGLDLRTVRAVERTRRHLDRVLRVPSVQEGDDESLLRCIFAGYRDRLARRRLPGSPRALMVGGTGVMLAESSVVREAELFVAVDVEVDARQRSSEARVRLASAIRREWIDEMHPGAVRVERTVEFDAELGRVVGRQREWFGDLVLSERIRTDVGAADASDVLAAAARQDPRRAARVDGRVDALLERARFLQRWMPELDLPTNLEGWLADAVASLSAGKRSLDELRRADVVPVLLGMLTAHQRRQLEREAPTEYELPSGRRAAVTYEVDKPPIVSARIQELFGLRATPRFAAGRVGLVIELLGPNYRPVQITNDLEGFWRRTYPEIRKELRGRYPKHPWPEDPFAATPTSKTGRAAIAASKASKPDR